MKCFSNSFIYDCCISSIVRIFMDYLKWRWQEKRHLNMSKRREVFQWQLYIRLLYVINCQDLQRIFETEMTVETTPKLFERAWSVSVTALNTIVVYHQLSGFLSNIGKGDNRKIDISVSRNGVKCISDSFMYDCCISSIVRIFIEYLKWRWQEKRYHNLSNRREVFQ